MRRLILKKLYHAWLTQNKHLQVSRFRAGQVLTRVARRIQERMTPKEFQMVSFHLWHRYAAVKAAHRRDEPEQLFMVPYIQRWPRLLRILNSKRITKKRAAEKASRVMVYRAWKGWRKAMESERSDAGDEDKEERARRHYEDRLNLRIIHAWCGAAKERGRNKRRREKCFR